MKHFRHFMKHFAFGFSLLFIIVLILHFSLVLPGFWAAKIQYLYFAALFLMTSSLFLGIREMNGDKREKSGFLKFISYMFLLSLVVIALNQFLKRQIILDYQFEIISFSIALGFLTFYANSQRAEMEMREEKTKDEILERKR